jgi:membrane glycosyltransferase
VVADTPRGDPAVGGAVAPPRHRPNVLNEAYRQEQVERAMEYGLDALGEPQKIKLLDDPVVLSRVHGAMWRSREDHAVSLRERTVRPSAQEIEAEAQVAL